MTRAVDIYMEDGVNITGNKYNVANIFFCLPVDSLHFRSSPSSFKVAQTKFLPSFFFQASSSDCAMSANFKVHPTRTESLGPERLSALCEDKYLPFQF